MRSKNQSAKRVKTKTKQVITKRKQLYLPAVKKKKDVIENGSYSKIENMSYKDFYKKNRKKK